MKVMHRVSLTPSESQRSTLLALGLQLIESKSPLVRLVSFDIEEGEASWPRVKALIDQWNPADFVRTEFTGVELDSASLLQMLGYQKGYPQPEDDLGYLKATYDLAEYCPECGIGKKQVTPFRMKGEPKWGGKHILQLNWVYDEYFVPTTVWEEVFHPLGIGRLAVTEHRTGRELRTVVQLDINDTVKSELSLGGRYPLEICRSCGRARFFLSPEDSSLLSPKIRRARRAGRKSISEVAHRRGTQLLSPAPCTKWSETASWWVPRSSRCKSKWKGNITNVRREP